MIISSLKGELFLETTTVIDITGFSNYSLEKIFKQLFLIFLNRSVESEHPLCCYLIISYFRFEASCYKVDVFEFRNLGSILLS